MLLYPFYQWNYRNAKGVLHVHHAVLPITHKGKYVPDFHEGVGFGVLPIRVG
jgi:hypothetical protein